MLHKNDTQHYIPIKHKDRLTHIRLEACLHELKLCLTNNFILLNDDKTQIILFVPNELSNENCIDLGTLSPYLTSNIKNVGFYLDSSLKLDKQNNIIISTCFYYLCQIAIVKSFLCKESFEKVIHAFIST